MLNCVSMSSSGSESCRRVSSFAGMVNAVSSLIIFLRMLTSLSSSISIVKSDLRQVMKASNVEREMNVGCDKGCD